MAKVHILNVTVHNNPAPFFTPFQFEIHFECLEELQDDLEFKIIYVGSAETYEFDQVLDQIVVDAVPQGQFKFMFQADPPDTAKIPGDDAVGVTVVLITASYREQEFVRVGYYITNEYEDMELRDNPPAEPQFDKLVRTIAANEPRVTKFKINWDSATASTSEAAGTSNTEAVAAENNNSNNNQTGIAINSSTGASGNNADVDMQANVNSGTFQQPIAQPQNDQSANFENKENILKQQQQQKFLANDSSTGQAKQESSSNVNSLNSNQQFIETSYDSMMN